MVVGDVRFVEDGSNSPLLKKLRTANWSTTQEFILI